MNLFQERANLSGLDLNIEAQTLSLLRISADGAYASTHACVRISYPRVVELVGIVPTL